MKGLIIGLQSILYLFFTGRAYADLHDALPHQDKKDHAKLLIEGPVATNQMKDVFNSQDTIIRHRELFLSKDYLCSGATDGVFGLFGLLITLLTFGLIKMPGHGGDEGKGKGKGYRRLGRRQKQQRQYSIQKLRMLQDHEYLEKLSESETRDLVNKILMELEWNEEGNPELHGRKLFNILEKLGLVNCNPTCNSSTCVSPQCVKNGEGFTAEIYACVGTECVFTEEFTFCDSTCTDGVGCA